MKKRNFVAIGMLLALIGASVVVGASAKAGEASSTEAPEAVEIGLLANNGDAVSRADYRGLVDVAASAANSSGVSTPIELASIERSRIVSAPSAIVSVVPFADGTGACRSVEPELFAANVTVGGCADLTTTPYTQTLTVGTHGFIISGLYTDDVVDVRISTKDGETHAVDMADNVFDWQGQGWGDSGVPTALVVTNSAGKSWSSEFLPELTGDLVPRSAR